MPQPIYEALLARVHRIHDLGKAAAVLSWDREVNMPPGGEAARVAQMTTLQRLIHDLSTADETGAMIEEAASQFSGAAADRVEVGLLRVLRHDFERAQKLPQAFVVELTQVGAKAWRVWRQAREADDFASFQPHLQRLVELQVQRAELLGYENEPYDALLDLYEREAKTTELRTLFDAVKAETKPLLEAIVDRGRTIDDALLHQHFPVEGQKAFARHIATEVGYDFERGHLGTATHPFATSFSRDDARITTRWHPDFLSPSLFGTLHECGHAMYEQGTATELARTPLARGTSSGIHESQSRMIENMLGRSLGFWIAHYASLQAQFPAQLAQVTLEDFHAAINKVQPSLIRVEADELTYNLHIILRFELEQAMLSGDLKTADLPGAWNERFEQLLGVRPPNDREGVLQDVHWSGPSFGYFPTYALGNLYAAQLYRAALDRDASIAEELAAGQSRGLMTWLGSEVHRHGRMLTPRELVLQATGQPLSHHAFIDYVQGKFSALYAL